MSSFIYNLWDMMWPNVFAPSVFSLFAIILSHIKRGQVNKRQHAETRAHIDRKHEEMKAHITGAVVSTAWMKPERPGPRD
jgi:hypothetical protein